MSQAEVRGGVSLAPVGACRRWQECGTCLGAERVNTPPGLWTSQAGLAVQAAGAGGRPLAGERTDGSRDGSRGSRRVHSRLVDRD